MRLPLALIALLWASLAHAGTLYIDTAANGSASANFSGSTDATTAKAGTGAGTATVTCSATAYTGGLPGCTFSGSPDLSGVIATPGATQDSLYVSCSTLTNQKIVWIIAVDDGADAVETATTSTTAAAPTGCTAATATWNIGGRAILTNATDEGALRAGDTAIFNVTAATQSATSWTFRNAGDTTSGYATIMGKSGTRPVLNTSGSANPTVNANSLALVRISNLEIKQSHASNGVGIAISGSDDLVDNVKVTAAGTIGITDSTVARFDSVEVTGTVGDCFNQTNNSATLTWMYLHDCGGDGLEITATAPTVTVSNSVIDTNVGRGIFFSSTSVTTNTLSRISNTTVYNNGDSGVEVADKDTSLSIINSIFTENGNAANEYNVEYTAGSIDLNGFHAYNTFWCTGLAANVCTNGAGNVSGLTVNNFVAASEILVDPLMSDPANGNFNLTSPSPAKGTGFPGLLLGTAATGYMSMGAEQVQAGASGAHGLIIGGP